MAGILTVIARSSISGDRDATRLVAASAHSAEVCSIAGTPESRNDLTRMPDLHTYPRFSTSVHARGRRGRAAMAQRAGDRRAPIDSLKERVDEACPHSAAEPARTRVNGSSSSVTTRLWTARRGVSRRSRLRPRSCRSRPGRLPPTARSSTCSGPVGIWTWPIVVVGQLAVALVYGSLAARIPVTGYSYQWMSRTGQPDIRLGDRLAVVHVPGRRRGRRGLHDRLGGGAEPVPLHRDGGQCPGSSPRSSWTRPGSARGLLHAMV